ncbi:ORF6N domain-containing protein [Anseongella ginsenosidimutans]|uniref:ORF6N domain-containing protein n=2 Tax=Anseongella ginsenosidimutans TaxID=496056 RepID=A0A4R3KLQ9_9SPHI|nr:ORF6N domain-containing protein [Anseongella ginsenosidimutans]
MLDSDLASLYEVETRVLNQAVKRNIARFPNDFMFQLKFDEYENIERQVNALERLSSQFVMMNKLPSNRTDKYLPFAFTEQGIAMLSGVLRSDKAIKMNIAIMRAFVEVRKILLQHTDLREQLNAIKERLGEHDTQLNHIYDSPENLLNEKAAQLNWEKRQRIGFKT